MDRIIMNFSFEEGILASVIFSLFIIVGILVAVSSKDNDDKL